MDELIGVNRPMKLGVIPEFFKQQCIENSYKPYYAQNNHLNDKDDIFTLEVCKNNVNQIKNGKGQFNFDDLQKVVIASGDFDGTPFHPNVRYEIDIRGIIPDIINVITDYLSLKNYTSTYGDVKLTRYNKLTPDELEYIKQY